MLVLAMLFNIVVCMRFFKPVISSFRADHHIADVEIVVKVYGIICSFLTGCDILMRTEIRRGDRRHMTVHETGVGHFVVNCMNQAVGGGGGIVSLNAV